MTSENGIDDAVEQLKLFVNYFKRGTNFYFDISIFYGIVSVSAIRSNLLGAAMVATVAVMDTDNNCK